MEETDLLSEFAIKVYEPPLSLHRASGQIADTSDPVSVAMLVVDLDTEVAMNGMVNFIGNSTGLYASQTVEALERIGCAEDASVLRQILAAAEAAGMTHAAIQDRPVQPVRALRGVLLRGPWREVASNGGGGPSVGSEAGLLTHRTSGRAVRGRTRRAVPEGVGRAGPQNDRLKLTSDPWQAGAARSLSRCWADL